jgi:hypothetical protein
MVFIGRFIVTVSLEFLNRLVQQREGKVFLIVNRHAAHRAKRMKQWLIKHSEQIRLFYLCGSSPEINPDELLNQDVKTDTSRKNRPNQQGELAKNRRVYLRKRQMQPHFVANYFQGKHVRYAAVCHENN